MGREEKTRLATEYEAATSTFSEAVKELHRKIGTSAKEEYRRLERSQSRRGWPLSNTSLPIVANPHYFTGDSSRST